MGYPICNELYFMKLSEVIQAGLLIECCKASPGYSVALLLGRGAISEQRTRGFIAVRKKSNITNRQFTKARRLKYTDMKSLMDTDPT